MKKIIALTFAFMLAACGMDFHAADGSIVQMADEIEGSTGGE